MFKLASPTTPMSSPSIRFDTGGQIMVANFMPHLPHFCCCVMGEAAIASGSYLFKDALQKLANELGIEIRIAHYPPYTSKYNPIEHRLFPHLTRVCRGVIFDSVETVKELMTTATTSRGLKVFTTVIERVYQTGKKATKELKANLQIVFDEVLPKWNYTAQPQLTQVD